MTDKQRPLRDRALVLCGQLNEREGCFSEACIVHDLIDELDRLLNQFPLVVTAKKDAQVEMRKEIEELKAANAKQKQVINDWIGHPESGMENSYESIVEKQQRCIETYRKCLEIAERQLNLSKRNGVLSAIQQIKKEGGIE